MNEECKAKRNECRFKKQVTNDCRLCLQIQLIEQLEDLRLEIDEMNKRINSNLCTVIDVVQ